MRQIPGRQLVSYGERCGEAAQQLRQDDPRVPARAEHGGVIRGARHRRDRRIVTQPDQSLDRLTVAE